MSPEDIEFYHRRICDETELAYAATDGAIARAHAELALYYSALIDIAENRVPIELPATPISFAYSMARTDEAHRGPSQRHSPPRRKVVP